MKLEGDAIICNEKTADPVVLKYKYNTAQASSNSLAS
jgi:hypothetical protein